jgi:hypothetical protein
MWTNDWNGGAPVWNYGFTSDGDALFRYLSVKGLHADWITTGKLSSVSGDTYFDVDNDAIHLESVISTKAVAIDLNATVGLEVKVDAVKTLGLATGGRSFVQSITNLADDSYYAEIGRVGSSPTWTYGIGFYNPLGLGFLLNSTAATNFSILDGAEYVRYSYDSSGNTQIFDHTGFPMFTFGPGGNKSSKHLMPISNGTYDLGSSDLRWRTGYFTATVTAATLVTTAPTYYGRYGSASFSWGGSTLYPTLYSDHADRWAMICDPHVPFLKNGSNGYTGTTSGATITFGANPACSAEWRVGIGYAAASVWEDVFAITRGSLLRMHMTNDAKSYWYGDITISEGQNLNLRAATGSTDAGDVIFSNGDGSEAHRIYGGGTGSLYYRYNAGTQYYLLHSGNWSSYCAAASHSHSYLPLAGGTLTGTLYGTLLGTSSSPFSWLYTNGLRVYGTATMQSIIPETNGTYSLGNTTNRWSSVWCSTGTFNSDYRLKHDIAPIDKGIDFILNLEPVQFKFNDGSSERNHYGFIAQDVKKAANAAGIGDCAVYVDPEVKPDWDTSDEELNNQEHHWALRYTEIIAPLVQTVQHLHKRITELETQLQMQKKMTEELT